MGLSTKRIKIKMNIGTFLYSVMITCLVHDWVKARSVKKFKRKRMTKQSTNPSSAWSYLLPTPCEKLFLVVVVIFFKKFKMMNSECKLAKTNKRDQTRKIAGRCSCGNTELNKWELWKLFYTWSSKQDGRKKTQGLFFFKKMQKIISIINGDNNEKNEEKKKGNIGVLAPFIGP